MASWTDAARSTSRATPTVTAEMSRRPPGDPTTAHGEPSRNRIAGAAAWSARRPGAGEILRPGRRIEPHHPVVQGIPEPGRREGGPEPPAERCRERNRHPVGIHGVHLGRAVRRGSPPRGEDSGTLHPSVERVLRASGSGGRPETFPAAARGGSQDSADREGGSEHSPDRPGRRSDPETPTEATPPPDGRTRSLVRRSRSEGPTGGKASSWDKAAARVGPPEFAGRVATSESR